MAGAFASVYRSCGILLAGDDMTESEKQYIEALEGEVEFLRELVRELTSRKPQAQVFAAPGPATWPWRPWSPSESLADVWGDGRTHIQP